ncbi:MAG: KH domain-containing protein [Acidimicrobiales bacterium]
MSVDPGELASYRVCKYLVQSIVEHPDDVKVRVDDGDSRYQLEVSVADGDMGRVIGKRGRVANAIRTVVRAAAAQDDIEVDVEFLD